MSVASWTLIGPANYKPPVKAAGPVISNKGMTFESGEQIGDDSNGDEKLDRIVIGLFGNSRTSVLWPPERRAMATKGSKFHRVIKSFMIQGGDFTDGNGTGGKSIYGNRFEDENFKLRHTGPGLLCMATAGKDTNGSQFFITTVKTAWLDGKHVVLARFWRAWTLLLPLKTQRLRSRGDKPLVDIVIVDSGELPVEENSHAEL
ncbi:Peptidyl-prolyl cis-trans isomerase B [Umbelopsis nana]